MSENIYSFSGVTMQGKEVPLSGFKGKVLLVVNTASKCGFTPQFKGLEELHAKYKGKGLEILGFPCNQFGKQDPGSNDEINQFCELNYGVTFTMFQKVDVNGDNAHPLFKYLKKQAPGVLGTEAIKWNFTKFLVDQNGKVLERYAPTDTPEKIEKDVARLLA
ncbi:MAG: glutathione peroxidase [Gammaproteobacteria bacterium]|nr:glutathione peroxidase [Gammaproteobacteria bacterium]